MHGHEGVPRQAVAAVSRHIDSDDGQREQRIHWWYDLMVSCSFHFVSWSPGGGEHRLV